jgi:hypothetical protein
MFCLQDSGFRLARIAGGGGALHAKVKSGITAGFDYRAVATERATQRQRIVPFASVWLIWPLFTVHLTFGRFKK